MMKVVIELDGKHALILHNSNVITIHYWFCTASYFNSGALSAPNYLRKRLG